ncbi:DUF4129 domain-containing protein [Caldilinea sp.]|jgi:hypothetical protein|uniref:DUF4129 domain-containing protein n=1 Tax=Caldilinea sp. TaxID=2293560 RepID=UPI001B042E0D|nr:DUF4129 domain-containing protein [Caldilinea sp.]MBO9392466.1 DUF4129 domain-containing protein [Caldilinea sp.]
MSRRIGDALWLALWLFGIWVASARAQEATPQPVSLTAYRQALEKAYGLLQKEPPAVEEAQRLLAAMPYVSLENGEVLAVLSPLDNINLDSVDLDGADLDGVETSVDVEIARQRLRLLIAQLDAAGSDRPAERLAVLERILSSPAFQQRLSWRELLQRWLVELFEQLFARSPAGAALGPLGQAAAQVAGWVVVALAGAVLLFLLARWLQTVLRAFVGDVGRAPQEADVLPTTPRQAQQAAVRSAERGAYRSAVRYLYLAALLTLQERRLIPRDPSLTNRELLTRVPVRHPLRTPLGEVVTVFEEVWYGVREPDLATFRRYQQILHELERLAQTDDIERKEIGS